MTAFYVFGALLLTLVVVVVWSALREGESGEEPGVPTAEERKEAAIDALRELEFDYQTGKLAEEDYQVLRHQYAREAVQARDAAAAPELAEEQISAAGDHELSADDRSFCAACGAELGEPARFCPRCGVEQETAPRPPSPSS